LGRSGTFAAKLKASGRLDPVLTSAENDWLATVKWPASEKSGAPSLSRGVGTRLKRTSRTTDELNFLKMGRICASTSPTLPVLMLPIAVSGRSSMRTSPVSPHAARVPHSPFAIFASSAAPAASKQTPANPWPEISPLNTCSLKPRNTPAGIGTSCSSTAVPILMSVGTDGPRSCASERLVMDPGSDMPASAACTFTVAGTFVKVPLYPPYLSAWLRRVTIDSIREPVAG
jgi:hypothetical protein